jgi:hypothetical protein
VRKKVVVAEDVVRHAPEHFFKGVCICPCTNCTTHPFDRAVKCICPDCPDKLCGLKIEKVIV